MKLIKLSQRAERRARRKLRAITRAWRPSWGTGKTTWHPLGIKKIQKPKAGLRLRPAKPGRDPIIGFRRDQLERIG